MSVNNVSSIAFTEFAPQVKAYASKTAEQLKQILSEEGNRTQADQFVKDIKTLNTNCEGIKTQATTEAEKEKNAAEKKNIFRRGWDGIKSVFNTILKPFKWIYNKLFSKSTEKEAKTGEAATQTEAQTQTQNTTTTSNTEGGATTETKPPATNTSNQASTQTQTAA